MRIAVILPFLDEAAALPATLAALERAAGADPDIEVVAVDAGSRDASRAILACRPHVRVIDAERGRSAQMNAGARATRAPTLLFLHADTSLPDGAFDAIRGAASRPGFVYGGFRHRFDADDWRLRAISALHNFRCARARTFYGDQALFVSREGFERAGGFPAGLVEDIGLSQRLRALGAPAFLDLAVTTSARKFVAMGVWRSFGRILAILVCLRFGLEPPRAFFADVR